MKNNKDWDKIKNRLNWVKGGFNRIIIERYKQYNKFWKENTKLNNKKIYKRYYSRLTYLNSNGITTLYNYKLLF